MYEQSKNGGTIEKEIFVRQATISEFENGKTEPDAETLLLLSHYLDKPITYFFPEPFKPDLHLNKEELDELEKELIIQIRKLDREDIRRLIAQAKALAELQQ